VDGTCDGRGRKETEKRPSTQRESGEHIPPHPDAGTQPQVVKAHTYQLDPQKTLNHSPQGIAPFLKRRWQHLDPETQATPTTPGDDSYNRRREREVVVDIDNLGTAPDAPPISGKTDDVDSDTILVTSSDQKAHRHYNRNTRNQDPALIVNNKTQR
jgi:hypothetical protein